LDDIDAHFDGAVFTNNQTRYYVQNFQRRHVYSETYPGNSVFLPGQVSGQTNYLLFMEKHDLTSLSAVFLKQTRAEIEKSQT